MTDNSTTFGLPSLPPLPQLPELSGSSSGSGSFWDNVAQGTLNGQTMNGGLEQQAGAKASSSVSWILDNIERLLTIVIGLVLILGGLYALANASNVPVPV